MLLFGALLLNITLFLPWLGLPPTRFGFYHQVDPVICGLWAIGGLAGLWVSWFARVRQKMAKRVLQRPAVWGPLLLAVASVVLGVFHTLPLRDWTGSGQMAEGVLTFLSTAFLSFMVVTLFLYKTYRQSLFWSALISSLVLSILTFIGSQNSIFMELRFWEWAPFFFADYLGFVLFGVLGIYLAVRESLPCKRMITVFVIIYLAFVAWISMSSTVKYGLVSSIFFVSFVYFFPTKNKRGLSALGLISICLAITLSMLYYDSIQPLLPEGYSKNTSLISRMYLLKMTILKYGQSVFNIDMLKSIFFGGGWGSYGNDIVSSLFLVKNVSSFKGDVWTPSWEFLERDLMHTHNVLGEHFSALGLAGVLLFLITRWYLVKSLNRSYFYFSFFTLLMLQLMNIMWFQLPNTLPFTIIAVAALCHQSTRSSRIGGIAPSLFVPQWIWKALAVPALVMLVFSVTHGVNAYLMTKKLSLTSQKDLLITMHDYLKFTNILKKYDASIGAQRLVNYARGITTETLRAIEKHDELDSDALLESVIQVANNLASMVSAKGNNLSLIVAMNIYGEVASNPKWSVWFFSDISHFNHWQSLATQLMDNLPSRSDILIPFLSTLSARGKNDVCLAYSKRILRYSEKNPIGLWFAGLSLLQEKESAMRGIYLLQRSVKQGIGRFMPIPELETSRLLEVPVQTEMTVSRALG